MNRSIVETLCCPSCRVPYSIQEIQATLDSIETAFLTCPLCCITVPVANGFPIFDLQWLSEKADLRPVMELLFGTEQEYTAFLEQKKLRPGYDLYAAFQPFNESTQSLFPLISLLRDVVRPGSFILDLWCRTGWSGELLASLFPDQFVISIWEGPSGVLGTKGFQHWLGSGKRLKNLEIVFHSPNLPLPFPDRMFSIVHGLDTLHRYKHVPLIPECMRIVRQDGILLFPHIHLTNSEPDPYFDRGEDQLHGADYQEYFSRLLKQSNRKAYILSEKTLFDAGSDYVLKDETNTDHYNACLLLAESRHDGSKIKKEQKNPGDYQNAQIIINPLWSIDSATGVAVPAGAAMEGGGNELFFRHPMYHQRLNKHLPVRFSEEQRILFYWASKRKTVIQIAEIMKREVVDIFDELLEMESKELLQIQNVSTAMSRLQSFYSTQRAPAEPGSQTLKHLWEKTCRLHGDRPFVLWPQDDSVFSYSDADLIVRKTISLLRAQGISEGNRVVISAVSHPEFIFLFWGAILSGAVVVVVSPHINRDSWNRILQNTDPRLLLIHADQETGESVSALRFGLNEGSPDFENSFSARVADFEPAGQLPDPSEDREAVILFTSGTTGDPKGIFLSNGGLYRTSEILDQAYKWRTEDRLLSAGMFHTLSGLRNPCIAVLHSGASVVVPAIQELQNPISILSLCAKYGTTILNVTPAFLAYWGGSAAQKSKHFHSHKLRMVLSTGSALQPLHREIFSKQFAVPIYDYYGLTETTGACILETEDLSRIEERGIGKPWDCIVKICEDGELAIYSDNLMLGYLQDTAGTARRIQDGWLMTGDMARIHESGCVVLIGRKDRMMKDKTGEVVYPEEIESAISAMEHVVDVYVTAYQDDLFVEQIAALIQFDRMPDDPERLLSKMRLDLAKKIPAARIPVFLIAIHQMPRAQGGKISGEAVKRFISTEIKRGR